jgi:hypothetical protein
MAPCIFVIDLSACVDVRTRIRAMVEARSGVGAHHLFDCFRCEHGHSLEPSTDSEDARECNCVVGLIRRRVAPHSALGGD